MVEENHLQDILDMIERKTSAAITAATGHKRSVSETSIRNMFIEVACEVEDRAWLRARSGNSESIFKNYQP